MNGQEGLNADMLAAHAAGNRQALISLYARAATISEGEAAAFYLTQSYIFALEAGDPRAASLRAQLVAIGAER